MGKPRNTHHTDEKCIGNFARKPAGYMEESGLDSAAKYSDHESIKAHELYDYYIHKKDFATWS
jgi:hypothetical protein